MRKTVMEIGYGTKKENATMKRSILTNLRTLVALIVTGVALSACSGDDENIESPQPSQPVEPQVYTMTVNATKGDGTANSRMTRALSLNGSTLNATWTAGDVVKVYNSSDTELGTLTAQSSGVSTTLSGSLSPAPSVSEELTLKYLSPNYSSQDGTLTGAATSIDRVCDYAEASVTVESVTGGNITTTGTAAFENKQAIVRFLLKNSDSEAISAKRLLVNADGNTCTVTPSPASSDVYVAIPAISSKAVTLQATVGDDTYIYERANATFSNGNYYSVSVKMAKVTDLSATETANCYIVPSKGYYKFKATVKGNGTADLAGISKNTDASSIASAGLVWATFGTNSAPDADELIRDISYSDGYVYFSTAKTYMEGNALVAIRDASENILWSWHIWLHNYNGTYLIGANSVKMMDCDLGALSTNTGSELSYGMYYQWGRKDPFVGPSAGTTLSAAYGQTKTINVGSVSVGTAIQNPTNYYIAVNASSRWTNGDHWCSDASNMTLWSDAGKTIFDPCPPGWRLPTLSEIEGMGSGYYSAGNGFPASGFIGTEGTYYNPGNGTIWATTTDGSCGKIKVMQGDQATWSRSPDMGFNVRCVKE